MGSCELGFEADENFYFRFSRVIISLGKCCNLSLSFRLDLLSIGFFNAVRKGSMEEGNIGVYVSVWW